MGRHDAQIGPPKCYQALTLVRQMKTWGDKQGDRPTMDTTASTDRHRGRAEMRCVWVIIAIAALLGGAHAPAASAGQVQVYRCEGVEGAVEFRQNPCPLDQPGETVTIEDHTTHWVPAPQAAEPTATPKTQTKPGRSRHPSAAPAHRPANVSRRPAAKSATNWKISTAPCAWGSTGGRAPTYVTGAAAWRITSSTSATD